MVETIWDSEFSCPSSSTRIAAKLKLLRRVLKRQAKGISTLKAQLKNCNEVLLILDKLEENRPLYFTERNFRSILKSHILKILQWQKYY
jgi:hypothetical protein